MDPELESKELNIKLLQSNINDISNRVKIMKFDHMHEQLRLVHYQNEGVEEHIQLHIKDKKKLEDEISENKKYEKELQEKIIKFTNDIKNLDTKNNELGKELEKEKENKEKFKKEKEKFLKIIEDNNAKCFANIKMIKSIFSKDKIVIHVIDKQILQAIKKHKEKKTSIKRELKILTVFLEEFVKLILYMKDTFREKDLKIQELHSSMKISQILRGGKRGLDDVLSKSQKSDKPQRQYHALLKIEEKMAEIRDKFEEHKNINSREEMEEIKNKNKILKEENSSLKNDIFLKLELIKELRDQNQEKCFRLYKNLIDCKRLNNELKIENENEVESNLDESVFDSEIIIPDHFNIYEYEEEYNEGFEKLKKTIKKTCSGKTKASIDLPDNFEELFKENEDLKKKLSKTNKKFSKFKKDYEETLKRFQFLKKEKNKNDFWDLRKSQDSQYKEFQKYKTEIKAKNNTIKNLVGVNDNLVDKLKVFQTERLDVLKDKQRCEDLFFYFKKKANEIVLLNEKLTKIVKENLKLKRLLKEILEKINLHNEFSAEDLVLSNKFYTQVIDEIRNSFFLILSKNGEFDTSIFNDYLKTKNSELIDYNKRREDNNQNKKPKLLTPSVKVEKPQSVVDDKEDDERKKEKIRRFTKLEEENEGIKQLFSGGKLENVKTLADLNKALIQNYHLKEKLVNKEKKILDLNRDLINYRKKMKFIKEIEPKIDQMVGENLKLRSMLIEIQGVSLENENSNGEHSQNFSNHMDVSFELLEKVKEHIRQIHTSKKNLDKKVFILQTQLNNLKRKRTEEIGETDLEIINLKHNVKNLTAKVKHLIQTEEQLRKLKQIRRDLENDLDISGRENDSLKMTIDLLEKNFYAISDNNNKDMEEMKKQIEKTKNSLNKKFDDENEFLNDKYSLEHRLEKLKDILKAKEVLIQKKDEIIEKLNEKILKYKSKVKNLRTEKTNLEKERNKASIENDILKSQNGNHEKNAEILKERITNFMDKNSKYLSDERIKIQNEMKGVSKNETDLLERKIKEMEEEVGGSRYLMEKKDKQLEDLKTKIKMKNKQLIHFNSYLVQMVNGNKPQVEMSRFLVQNRDLLKEIEKLRIQNNKIQNLYKNLQDSIDRGTVEEDFKKEDESNKKVKDLRNSFVDDLYANNYNLKMQFDVLDKAYKDKDSKAKKQVINYQNNIIKFKNKIDSLEEDLREATDLKDEIDEECKNIKEENIRVNKELAVNKNILKQSKQRNGLLVKELEEYKKNIDRMSLANSMKSQINNEEELQIFKEKLILQNEKLKNQVTELKEEIFKLKNQNISENIDTKKIENLKNINKDIKIDLEIAKKKINNLNDKILRVQEDKKTLTTFLESQKKKLEELEVENEEYDEFLNQLQDDFDENIDASTKNIISKYKKEIEDLKKKNSLQENNLNKIMFDLGKKHEGYENIIKQKDINLDNLKKEILLIKK